MFVRVLPCIALLFLGVRTAAAVEYSLGIDHYFSEVNIAGSKSRPKMNGLRLSALISPQIGFELVYKNNHKADSLLGSTVQLDTSMAAYIRLLSRTYDDVTMEVDLGYAETELTVLGNGIDFVGNNTYSGFSYRVVAEQALESIAGAKIRISYGSLYDNEELEIRGYSLGFSYQF